MNKAFWSLVNKRRNPCIKDTLLPRRVQSTPLSARSTWHMWELLAGKRTAVLPRHARGGRIRSYPDVCAIKLKGHTYTNRRPGQNITQRVFDTWVPPLIDPTAMLWNNCPWLSLPGWYGCAHAWGTGQAEGWVYVCAPCFKFVFSKCYFDFCFSFVF